MDVEYPSIPGLVLIKPRKFQDSRGYFVETWQKKRYMDHGIPGDFVQDNHSVSYQNVLRGIHFQIQHQQGKLVSVSLGRVYDVAVDLRPGSSSFGQWYGVELSHENQHQLWIPPGFGHGFCVLSESAHFHYKCTEYYVPGDEGTIIWNDSDLNISWPTPHPILSDKDAAAPPFNEWIGTLNA